MVQILVYIGKNGRFALPCGLIAGLFLPNLAQSMKPLLPEMILFLLFLTAYRIGHKDCLNGLKNSRTSFSLTLIYQLVLPIFAMIALWFLDLLNTEFAIAIILMLSAPPITGASNFTILLGHNPEPAFRILILGTLVLPITIMPVFWLSPNLGDLRTAVDTSLRLLVSIWIVVILAFVFRKFSLPSPTTNQFIALDGFTSIILGVVVIGFMSAIGPALVEHPFTVLKWLIIALIANLGLQYTAFKIFLLTDRAKNAVPFAVVAGNRNFALFLIALPPSTIEPLLIFLGCYQIPMYLTPILMSPIFKNANFSKHSSQTDSKHRSL